MISARYGKKEKGERRQRLLGEDYEQSQYKQQLVHAVSFFPILSLSISLGILLLVISTKFRASSKARAIVVCHIRIPCSHLCAVFQLLLESFQFLTGRVLAGACSLRRGVVVVCGGCVGISFVGTRRKCFINAEHKTRITNMCAAYQFVCFGKRKNAKYF